MKSPNSAMVMATLLPLGVFAGIWLGRFTATVTNSSTIQMQWDFGNTAVGIATASVAIISLYSIIQNNKNSIKIENMKEYNTKRSLLADYLAMAQAIQTSAQHQRLSAGDTRSLLVDSSDSIKLMQLHSVMCIEFDLDSEDEKSLILLANSLGVITDRYEAEKMMLFAKKSRKYLEKLKTQIES